MARILITGPITETALQLLQDAGHTLHIHRENSAMSYEELLRHIADFDGLICLLSDRIDRPLLEAGHRLKAVCNYAAGFNNIDIQAATQLRIPVCTTPGVLSTATAELAWALLLSAARHIPASDRFVREGRFKGWEPGLFLGTSIEGRTLGIIGAGRIGTAMAMMSRGFNMKLLYVSRSVKPHLEQTLNARRVELPQLLSEADFISIHTALTPETTHLISEKEFALMHPGSILINTSRGPVVDESALVRALREGRIAAAGLDVYEHEPELQAGLTDLDNVVLAPHTGSATRSTREEMALMSVHDMLSCLENRPPRHSVNFDRIFSAGSGV